MLPATIPIDRQSLTRFCKSHGVTKLSLFGSALRDDSEPERSDFDLLVEFAPGVSRSLFKLMRMQDELSEMLGRQVDLTTSGSLSKYFRDDVVAAAVVLYDAA
jgi:predicted nucleotidyltransferase